MLIEPDASAFRQMSVATSYQSAGASPRFGATAGDADTGRTGR